ncbi:DinB family protein [Deinococcus psychrotolerans]|uniref:DinB family protein n=1 Tax=Deinococcus psychrotolerans TaxID=2489213 RepID=A0A3G8YLI0_9DEIO|nr:DinB family protein [Deinococcus psychrotolerans]AZI42461.1 DinB family protein [Deinococcus psychrotolerans]
MSPEGVSRDLKTHVRALLTERQAHLQLSDVLEDFPLDQINAEVGLPYTAWGLLWHLWFTQRDILQFVKDEPYTELVWPTDYWPKAAGTAQSWQQTAESLQVDLDEFLALLDKADLFAVVPNGDGPDGGGQTWLREALLIADHNAYHLGQLMVVRRLLEK